MRIILSFTILLALYLMTACGGGGGDSTGEAPLVPGTDTSPAQIAIQPSPALYSTDTRFKPGQLVFLKLARPLTAGEQIQASDSLGSKLIIADSGDGGGVLQIPVDIAPGTYTVTVNINNVDENLIFEIDPVNLPATAPAYLNSIITQLSNQLDNQIQAQQVDSRITEAYQGLQELQARLPDMSTEEIETLATILHANIGVLDEMLFAGVPRATRLPENCLLPLKRLTVTGVATIASITWLTPTMAEVAMTTGPYAVVAVPAVAVVSFAANVALTVTLMNQVDELTACVFAPSDPKLESNTLLKARQNPAGIVAQARVVADASVSFTDREAKRLRFTVKAIPIKQASDLIKKIQTIMQPARSLLPDSVVSSIDNLNKPIFRDLTDEATLSVSHDGLQCSGNISAYTCTITRPANGPVVFQIEATHPRLSTPVIFSARLVLPGPPSIPVQSFTVQKGRGIINTLVMQDIVEPGTPNYEYLRIREYEILEAPQVGVILNAFTKEPNVIEYAIDPEVNANGISFTIRGRNWYGWSESQVVYLELTSAFPVYYRVSDRVTRVAEQPDVSDVDQTTGKSSTFSCKPQVDKRRANGDRKVYYRWLIYDRITPYGQVGGPLLPCTRTNIDNNQYGLDVCKVDWLDENQQPIGAEGGIFGAPESLGPKGDRTFSNLPPYLHQFRLPDMARNPDIPNDPLFNTLFRSQVYSTALATVGDSTYYISHSIYFTGSFNRDSLLLTGSWRYSRALMKEYPGTSTVTLSKCEYEWDITGSKQTP